jgi:biotin synthase-like enzyme
MNREIVDKLTRELTERGEVIQAGWMGYKLLAMNPNAPSEQYDECRMAFFAGANHLFGSMMSVLDPDAEPTESDLRMMNNIYAELKAYITTFKAKHGV